LSKTRKILSHNSRKLGQHFYFGCLREGTNTSVILSDFRGPDLHSGPPRYGTGIIRTEPRGLERSVGTSLPCTEHAVLWMMKHVMSQQANHLLLLCLTSNRPTN
jgi:hypothetical protein